MHSTFTNATKEKGSVLAFVLIAVGSAAVVVAAIFAMGSQEGLRNAGHRVSLARTSTLHSLQQALIQTAQMSVDSGGDWTILTSSTRLPLAAEALGDGDKVYISSTAPSNPGTTLGSRSAVFGGTAGRSGYTTNVSGWVSHARTTALSFTANYRFSPTPNAVVNDTFSVSASVVEIPTTEFQFVCSDSAFVQSISTDITVRGRALFNRGISTETPLGLRIDTSDSSSFSVIFGLTNIPTNVGYRSMPYGTIAGFTRCTGGMSNLLASPTASVSTMIDQQALSRAPGNYRIVWTNAAADPVNLPPGISRLVVLGVPRLVIDLSVYYGPQNLWIDCADPTTAVNGVVVLGSPNGSLQNASPLNIATTGKITLLGDNYRPVITATNYGLSIGPDRANPAATATSNVSWLGYICLAVSSPSITAASASWGSFRFQLGGTLSFPGGSINNANVPISIVPNSTVTNAFAASGVLADRIIFVEAQ